MVVPAEGIDQLVGVSRSLCLQLHSFAVIVHLCEAYVVTQRVVGCRQVDKSVLITTIIIVESGNLTFDVNLRQSVVDHTVQRQWLAQVQGDLQKLLQPVALVDAGRNGEVVVGGGIDLWQSW